VTGGAPTVGQTTQLVATATLSNGTAQDVTTQATWASSNASVLSISNAGVARGIGAGEADARATYGGASGSLRLSLAVRTFAVAGVISDSDTGRSIDAEVEIVDGPNAGKVSRADATGRYSLAGLVVGSFALRARATGYDSGDARVTILDSDARVDITLRHTLGPPNYAGIWTGGYKIVECTNIDPPGTTGNTVFCDYPTRFDIVYRFTLSQSGQAVTGAYTLLSPLFSCPCGGDYGTFDLSGTIAPDGSLALTATGFPRASGGVLTTETFNVKLASPSTLTGTLTGAFESGGLVRARFSGVLVSGTR
jgi:hypothetical protein